MGAERRGVGARPVAAAGPPGPRGWLRARVAGDSTPEFFVLAGCVGVLLLLGLLMTFSSSFVRSTQELGDPFGIFQRQLLWAAVGLPCMALAALVDYRLWRRVAVPLLVAAVVFAAAVLVPGVGVEAHGAQRWLSFGPLRFQPSEVLKLAVAVFSAHLVAGRWGQVRAGDLHLLVMPAVPVIAVASALVLAGPDLETAGLVALIGALVLVTAGLPLRFVVGAALVALATAAVAILATPFRRARVVAWLDPAAHAGTFGYQSMQGLIALGSGGLFGRGLGQGRGQWLYVPNAHTDFIFAIIGEELGLVGALSVLALFAVVAVTGVRIARRAPEPFGRLVAVAVTGWVLAQAGMNVGSVVGLLPVTGVTLPLVSFGGSSLVVTLVAMGLLLSVARHARPAPPGRRQEGPR